MCGVGGEGLPAVAFLLCRCPHVVPLCLTGTLPAPGAGRMRAGAAYDGAMGSLSPEQTAKVVALAMDLARAGRSDELVEFLDHGLPINVQDAEGNTLLMLAAYRGNLATVELLIARGADVDLRNGRDQSPIAGALFKGEDEIVRVLRSAGADLDAGTPSAWVTAEMFGRAHLLA